MQAVIVAVVEAVAVEARLDREGAAEQVVEVPRLLERVRHCDVLAAIREAVDTIEEQVGHQRFDRNAVLADHGLGHPVQGAIAWPVFEELREAWRGRIELQGVSLAILRFFRDEEAGEARGNVVP